MKTILVKPVFREHRLESAENNFEFPRELLENPVYLDRLASAAKKEETAFIIIGRSSGVAVEVLLSASVIVESIRSNNEHELIICFWNSSALLKLDLKVEASAEFSKLLTESMFGVKPVLIAVKNGFILNVLPYDGIADSWQSDRKVFEFAPANLRATVTEQELSDIFTYLSNESCVLLPNNIDQCITFQYAWDGCFARAHKMRQVMAAHFNLECQKIFNYGSLAIEAYNNCVTWGWHVAPLLTVVSPSGQNVQMVIDPSVASTPLTVDQWRNIQLNNCGGQVYLSYFDIVDGRCYGRNNGAGQYNSFDDTYYWTNTWLADHQNQPTFE